MPEVQLTQQVGHYAQAYFLGGRRTPSLTETMRAWREYMPALLPLPHPSPRNVGWFKANPWFEGEVLPTLRERVRGALA
jgi:uracil-DNA glycosylase